jgi:predicted nucleic acid-binding protein
MIVVDASAYVDVLLDQAGDALYDALETSGHWVVPEHFRLEVVSAVRGAWLAGRLADRQFDAHVATIARQDLDVWPTAPLLPRIREFAPNATPYDAAYLALAEELGSALVTADAKFARVPGIRCRVVGA